MNTVAHLIDQQQPFVGAVAVQGGRRSGGEHRTRILRARVRHFGLIESGSGDRERFLAEGFDGYVSKPVNVRELLGIVRQHCEGRLG